MVVAKPTNPAYYVGNYLKEFFNGRKGHILRA